MIASPSHSVAPVSSTQPIDWADVRLRAQSAPWSVYAAATLRLARHLVAHPAPSVPPHRHNHVLERARVFNKCVLTLAAAWRLTDEARFAERACALLEEVCAWPAWYWSSHVDTGEFDLCSGELALTIATLYDWLGDSLPLPQRARLYAMARQRLFEAYLATTPPTGECHWYRHPYNWNAVCNGGMLALALRWHGREPLAGECARRARAGLQYYLDGLNADGSSMESVHYWQYGTIYLTHALLAAERFSGTADPGFAHPALTTGLSFPFDFSPGGGAAVGFGDYNGFFPQGLLFALAARVGRDDVTAELHRRLAAKMAAPEQFDPYHDHHPDAAYALVHARAVPASDWARPPLRVYPDVGWGLFCAGGLTLGFRAGDNTGPHTHRDLGALALARGGVALLEGMDNWPYSVGWFRQPRDPQRGESRALYFEDGSASKNTLLLNGTGQIARAASQWSADQAAARMTCEFAPAYPWFAQRVARTVTAHAATLTIEDEIVCTAALWPEARFLTAGEFVDLGAGRFRVAHAGQHAVLTFSPWDQLEARLTRAAPSVPVKPEFALLRVFPRQPATHARWSVRIE